MPPVSSELSSCRPCRRSTGPRSCTGGKTGDRSSCPEVGCLFGPPGPCLWPQGRWDGGDVVNVSAGLPLVPLVGAGSYQFTVHEDDLADAIAALAWRRDVPTEPVGIANPVPVPFRQILDCFARDQGRRCRFVPVDWRLAQSALSARGKDATAACPSGLTLCLAWSGLPRWCQTLRPCSPWGSACAGSASRSPLTNSPFQSVRSCSEPVRPPGLGTSKRTDSGWWSLPRPSPTP